MSKQLEADNTQSIVSDENGDNYQDFFIVDQEIVDLVLSAP